MQSEPTQTRSTSNADIDRGAIESQNDIRMLWHYIQQAMLLRRIEYRVTEAPNKE